MFLNKPGSLVVIFVTFFLMAAAPFISGQNKSSRIDQLLNKYTEYKAFNGAVLVAEGGKVLFKKGYGNADFEWNIPNTPDTKFRLGSVTKQFTAMLIMQLVQKGKLKLDEKVSEILPEYPKEQGNKITIHNLLTHTSGIPNYTDFPDFAKDVMRNPFTPEQLVKLFENKPLDFEPGTKFKYSNSGYILLGYIIEKVTGKSYENVLQEYILDPLKMTNTGLDNNAEILPKRARGYEMSGLSVINTAYIDMSVPYAAGSIYSTVEDLYKWDQALYTDKLLTKDNLNRLFGKYIPAFGAYYGYGWEIKKDKAGRDSVNIVEHGGSVNGFNTLIVRFIDDKNLIVLLNNTGGTNLEQIANDITKILYKEPVKLPEEPSYIKFLKLVADKGIDEGIRYINSLSKSENKKITESQLNRFGYSLLKENKTTDAIKIFKANIDLHNSANTYDSYAEALMKDGQNEAAIINYKKSLEMNPGNTNAVEMLKKLGVEYKPELPSVDPKVFEQYIGEYQLAPNFIITVTTEGGKIFTQATGQSKVEIFPSSETEFYLKVVNAQLSFVKDESGKVIKMILHQNGRDIPGNKIK